MYLLQHVDVLCLPVDGEGHVLVDENELLLVYHLQHVDVLCLLVDGEGHVLVVENELLLVYHLQHVDVLCLLVVVRGMFLLGMRVSFTSCLPSSACGSSLPTWRW